VIGVRPYPKHADLAYGVSTANPCGSGRQASESVRFRLLNAGATPGPVLQKMHRKSLEGASIPMTQMEQGNSLRPEQQIFFVSCSLRTMFRILEGQGLAFYRLPHQIRRSAHDNHPASPWLSCAAC